MINRDCVPNVVDLMPPSRGDKECIAWLLVDRETFGLVEIRELDWIDVFDIVDCVVQLVLKQLFLVGWEERPFLYPTDIR